jgi:hypothetical protein
MKWIIITLLFFFTLVSFVNPFSNEYEKIINKSIETYNPKRKDYVIVIDYTKNILSERLFVINTKTKKTVISSNVSHAFNSGLMYATDFSNDFGSEKSCCGTFITKGAYNGSFGYSMVIGGLDKGVNDNAENRKIVFHSDEKMQTKWSLGCFATPKDINEQIINLTKGGCLVIVIK